MGEPWQAVVSQKVIVVDEGEVLLLREPTGDGDTDGAREGPGDAHADASGEHADASGEWEFLGGRIDRGEDTTEALHREVVEETGLDVAIGRPVATAVKRRSERRGKFFVYYRASAADRAVTLSPEHDARRWFSPDAARPLLNERRATALDAATDGLVDRG